MAARISSISHFSKIARDNLEHIALIEPKINLIRNKMFEATSKDDVLSFDYELMPLEDAISELSVITIVFSAIAVETYVFDYAARYLSDSYVKEYVDKLDPVSEWVIVPRLVTGRELPRNHKWFELLKSLIKERNLIVHNKSFEVPRFQKDVKEYLGKIKESQIRIQMKAKQVAGLLDLLITEMGALDSEEYYWINGNLGKSDQFALEEK